MTDTIVITRQELDDLKQRIRFAVDERDMIWSFMGRNSVSGKMQRDFLVAYPYMADVLK